MYDAAAMATLLSGRRAAATTGMAQQASQTAFVGYPKHRLGVRHTRSLLFTVKGAIVRLFEFCGLLPEPFCRDKKV